LGGAVVRSAGELATNTYVRGQTALATRPLLARRLLTAGVAANFADDAALAYTALTGDAQAQAAAYTAYQIGAADGYLPFADVFAAGKILAGRRFSLTTCTITDALDGVGWLGGKLYGEQRLKALASYLDRRGVHVVIGDEYLPRGKAAGFQILPDGQPQFTLGTNPTEYQVWHELSHYLHYRQIGLEAYRALPRSRAWHAAEQFVFDMLERPGRWNRLNFEEQQHAIDYIERIGGFR
jgi:hypothetical protein